MQNGSMLLVFRQEACPCFHHFPWVTHCFLLQGKRKEHCVSASEAAFPHWEMYLPFSIFPTTNSLLSDSGKTKPIQRILEGQELLLSVNLMHTTAKVSPCTTAHMHQINAFNIGNRDYQYEFHGGKKRARSHFLPLLWYDDATCCQILLLNCSLTARCPPQSCHQRRIAHTKVVFVCLSSCCAACLQYQSIPFSEQISFNILFSLSKILLGSHKKIPTKHSLIYWKKLYFPKEKNKAAEV